MRWWDGKVWTDRTAPQAPPPTASPFATAAPSPQGGSKGRLIVGVAVAVVVALGVGVWALTRSDDTTPSADTAAGSRNAPGVDECHSAVKAKLKAPSTAKFESAGAAKVEESTEQSTATARFFTVEGAVDSQNSYGAMIRSTYICAVVLKGGKWITDPTLVTIHGPDE